MVVSVIDFDEGTNGETTIEIKVDNELVHFRLEEFSTLLKSTASWTAGRSTSTTSLSWIHVNDHESIFEKSDYSAVLSERVQVGSYLASITAQYKFPPPPPEDVFVEILVEQSASTGGSVGSLELKGDTIL